jgi:ferredoxin--NADP+ reductase/benzoate/toluate 1,2-dioxygenase reductase subunit
MIKTFRNTEINEKLIEILNIRYLTASTYIIRLNKNEIQFLSGQYICLGFQDYPYIREYSIYSGENEDYIEVLIKEVLEGDVSKRLKSCTIGSLIRFEGPYGSFILEDEEVNEKKFMFIATGTGIAPFHSMIMSYPNLDYQLIHGVKTCEEAYDKAHYNKDRYILCTSRDKNGHYNGKVTDYLRKQVLNKEKLYYLSGNGNMIYEVNDILRKQGIPLNQIFLEVYF